MILKEILADKGSTVFTVESTATLGDVVAKLVEHNCGSLVVCEGDRMVGIITERDILRASDAHSGPLRDIPLASHMTSTVVTASPDDLVEDVMGLLTEKRIRHLPVLQDGQLVGLISIGDVVKAQHAMLSMENHYLKNYIQS